MDDLGDRPGYPHDRKTVRVYLKGRRALEVRVRREPTLADPFLEYCRLRLGEDPHLWASTLHDELAELGFTGWYPSMTVAILDTSGSSRVPRLG